MCNMYSTPPGSLLAVLGIPIKYIKYYISTSVQ